MCSGLSNREVTRRSERRLTSRYNLAVRIRAFLFRPIIAAQFSACNNAFFHDDATENRHSGLRINDIAALPIL